MPEIAVIAPLTEMKRGDEFAFGLVPLHVTALPNSALAVDVDQASVIVQEIADGFSPFDIRAHSTTQPDARLEIGESRTIDRLAVIDCTRPVRVITNAFPLNRARS